MAAQRKYPEELRDRAVKMVSEVRERDRKGHGELARVGRQLGGRSISAMTERFPRERGSHSRRGVPLLVPR